MTKTRAATAQDYGRIVMVVDECWGRPVAAALPRLFLDNFASTGRVAEDAHGLAGFPSPTPEVAYVHFVGVRPVQRRHGLAH
jgi:hypothetical protein